VLESRCKMLRERDRARGDGACRAAHGRLRILARVFDGTPSARRLGVGDRGGAIDIQKVNIASAMVGRVSPAGQPLSVRGRPTRIIQSVKRPAPPAHRDLDGIATIRAGNTARAGSQEHAHCRPDVE